MHNHHLIRTFSALVVAAGLGSASVAAIAQQAQPLPAPSTAPGTDITRMSGPDGMQVSDADFVRLVAQTNNAEVAEARYMLKNTQSPVVRNYAQRMVDDHTTANVELLSAVRSAKGRYPVPITSSGRENAADFRNLRALSGAALDKAYMQDQVDGHKKAVAVLQYEGNNGMDPALKVYAQRMLPAVTMHLRMSLAYAASNGASTAVDAAGTNFGGTGPGTTTPSTSANGTPNNNPGTTSKGGTNGTAAGTGTVNNQGNPANSGNGQPGYAQPTPLPLPTAVASPGATATPH